MFADACFAAAGERGGVCFEVRVVFGRVHEPIVRRVRVIICKVWGGWAGIGGRIFLLRLWERWVGGIGLGGLTGVVGGCGFPPISRWGCEMDGARRWCFVLGGWLGFVLSHLRRDETAPKMGHPGFVGFVVSHPFRRKEGERMGHGEMRGNQGWWGNRGLRSPGGMGYFWWSSFSQSLMWPKARRRPRRALARPMEASRASSYF